MGKVIYISVCIQFRNTSLLGFIFIKNTLKQDQENKLSSLLETIDEEIELFIDESDYLEVEWPEVVYKPRQGCLNYFLKEAPGREKILDYKLYWYPKFYCPLYYSLAQKLIVFY